MLLIMLEDKSKTVGVAGNVINLIKLFLFCSQLILIENYREQSKYDNHLIGKVALFQFVNSFLSLFYIAFYLRDQEKLKEVRRNKFLPLILFFIYILCVNYRFGET